MNKSVTLIDQVASDKCLDEAYRWLCEQRKESGPNNDVWHLRFHWIRMKRDIKQALLSDAFHLSPLKRWKIDGKSFESWETSDSIVLKSLQLVLSDIMHAKILSSCTNIKGNGGLKQAVNKIQTSLPDYQFVFKSHIKRYYASIKHKLLLKSLQQIISDRIILRLVREYCKRLVWVKGEYEMVRMGIPLGCPLSPLMGSWFLQDIDQIMSKHQDCFYIRYMDDWVILTKTRNHLRKAIKVVNQSLNRLNLEKHPDKTFIGWIHKGFSFLGYTFGKKNLEIAVQTVDNHIQKLKSLYRSNSPIAIIRAYKKRWLQWVKGGINSIFCGIYEQMQTPSRFANGPP